jgi:hypothetical protein
MRPLTVLGLLATLLGLAPAASAAPPGAGWKAGVAVQVITPAEPMWMSGYASRDRPAEGKLQDLYVKALALQSPDGAKLVLVTSDLVGVPRSLSEAVAAEVGRRTGLPRERLMLTVSHTHCGPVVNDSLSDMYNMPAAEARKIAPYTEKLRGWMVGVVVRALGDLRPAELAVGKGSAGFAVNRRKPTPKGFINDANPAGPVDHDVPVLRVGAPGGKLIAVVFGYACHNTTLQFYRWCGDYAGFAQEHLEKKHKGAVALFWAGCGGDANPLPRSTVELCRKYGRRLGEAVDAVLAGRMAPVEGGAAAAYTTVALPYAAVPDRGRLAADVLSKNFAVRSRARRLLALLDKGGKIDDHYRHYPVQVWRLGRQVTWVALGGEVVVDYSLRLKKELGGAGAVWVTAYANDVMAYVPSERVLREGGYEGDTSMVPYGLPSKWAPGLEAKIVGAVRELVKRTAAGARR